MPYVVSHPAWLVAASLPPTERSTLLFFRGHLPRSSIDTKNVRRFLMRKLTGECGGCPNLRPSARPSLWEAQHLCQLQ